MFSFEAFLPYLTTKLSYLCYNDFLHVFFTKLTDNPTFYSRVPKPLPLEGVLAPNNLLDNTERLFENQIHGPENLIYHNGAIYTGVHGGELIKIIGNKFEHVAKFGKPCGKL